MTLKQAKQTNTQEIIKISELLALRDENRTAAGIHGFPQQKAC